jgi:uncharacterized protein YjbI with pentapeptide repeats
VWSFADSVAARSGIEGHDIEMQPIAEAARPDRAAVTVTVGEVLAGVLVAAGLCLAVPPAGQSFAQANANDGATAAGRSFHGQRLGKASFAHADLRNSDFSGAIVDAADFQEAQLQGANFSGASLRKANFFNAQLDGANFSRAVLDGASLVQANLPNANFTGASLRGASFGNGNMQGIDFTSADLESADLNSMLRGVNFHNANLRGAVFGFGVPTYLEGANLSGAQLEGAIFEGVFLTGADLRGAKLQGVLFGGSAQPSDLQGANLDAAGLQAADLGGIDFQGASLAHAQVWRSQDNPTLKLTDTTGIDLKSVPKLNAAAILRVIADPWKGNPGIAARLKTLNPAKPAARNTTPAAIWAAKPPGTKELAEFLAELACKMAPDNFSYPARPYVARGLISNGRLLATGYDITIVGDKMRAGKADTAACPGVAGLADQDWAALDDLVAKAGAAPNFPGKP